MHWLGIAALTVGAVLAFAVGGDLTAPAYATMVVGAALLIAGVVRLGRTARRARSAVPDAEYRTGKGKIAGMVAATLYILSPLDIVPDVLLPVGVIDDATALAWLAFALGQELTRHSRRRRLTRDSSRRPRSSRPPPPR
ncbi:YkvA family protein [Thermomonospora umbrina]|uniref:Uncharacterized membrane protein YkvA (DUF1232 family) n=1 Tax=Thermomonospora umbrina TaxID=111806 RepID=A0A3D9T611_9ACTN|nr:YkvA family protein [Thermomonospora umbrina]REF00135.1 uncharacterized membrane protein YkvA (DUF1232 family) [Thermomonospora umbrina]